MTKLQEIAFEMLKIFVDVCDQLNLTYYLVCGSALGAVKYGGFIPWDDDIDVALPRKDYETFLKEAPVRLPDWCFLQNHRTDPQFPLLGSKLRDTRTTFVEKMCGKLKMHHGVFIDVFPLDGIYPDLEKKHFHSIRKNVDAKRRVHLDYHRYGRGNLLQLRTNCCWLLNRLFGVFEDTSVAIAEFDNYVSSFSTNESRCWCNYANSDSEKEFAPREQYGNGIMLSFEGLQVRVPEQYDAYLTQKYGNWRADIPKEQQVGHHLYEVMDLERPYHSLLKR